MHAVSHRCWNAQEPARLDGLRVLAAVLVVNGLLEAFAQPMDAEAVTAVLRRQAYNIQAIDTVEFQGKVLVERGDDTPGIVLTFSFVAKGSMYRSEFETGSTASQSRSKTVNAFDGKFFQSKTDNALVVSRSVLNPRAILMHNPLFLVYGFAVDAGDFPPHLGVLCEPSFFTRVARDATALKPGTWGNHECDVVTFIRESRTVGTLRDEVYFAKDLGYFPIRTRQKTVPGRSRVSHSIDLRVNDLAQFETPSGTAIVIPTKIESSGVGVSHNARVAKQILTAVVDRNSLRVNHPVENEVFTLVVTEDDHVYDADLGVYIKSGKKGIPPKVAKLMLEDVEVFRGRTQDMTAKGGSGLPRESAPTSLNTPAGNVVSTGIPGWRSMALVAAGILAVTGAYLCLRKGKGPR